MRLMRKKGFTIIELVIVIVIIAVLAAMVLPMLMSSDSNKSRVVSGAKDFYTAAQHLFSKFAKVERDYNPLVGIDPKATLDPSYGQYVICYDEEFGGNRPVFDYVFLCAHIENRTVDMVDAYSSDDPRVAMAQVLKRNNRNETHPNHVFTEAFRAELDTLFDGNDGYYYALVYYDDTLKHSVSDTAGNNLVKVLMTGYGDYELGLYEFDVTDEGAVNFDGYRDANLLTTSEGILSTGFYFGVQSSEKQGDKFIGEAGTYFFVEK